MALGAIGMGAAPAVPVLVRYARTGEMDVRGATIRALGAIGGELAEPAVPVLVEALAVAELKEPATIAISRIGPAAAPAATRLVTLLSDETLTYRTSHTYASRPDVDPDAAQSHRAAEALAAIGTPAVPALIVALRDAKPVTRMRAAEALREIGASGANAAPMLESLARSDGEMRVRRVAAAAYAAVLGHAPTVVENLLEWLLVDDRFLRHRVVAALSRVGAPAVPRVVERLQTHEDPEQRRLAARALEAMGAEGGPGAGALVAALADDALIFVETWDPEQKTQHAAVLALAAIGVPSLEGLVVALRSDDPDVRARAAWAIELSGTTNEAAGALLAKLATDDPSADVREHARRALDR
jgi:HEAT repeat protein